jgi:hypothetical protein
MHPSPDTTVSGSDARRQDEQPDSVHLALSTTSAVQDLDAAGVETCSCGPVCQDEGAPTCRYTRTAGVTVPRLSHDANDEDPHVMSALNDGVKRDPPPAAGAEGADHGDEKPIKVYGLMVLEKSQKPLIEKHCFGDCGKISMAGAINDDMLGGLMVCCEEACPWLLKQMEGEPYGTTMSFGRPHEVYLRTLTDTPAGGSAPDGQTDTAAISRAGEA